MTRDNQSEGQASKQIQRSKEAAQEMQGGSAGSPCQWKNLLRRDLSHAKFDAVLSDVLQSTEEMEKIQGLNETDFQNVIDTFGKVRELLVR